MEGESIERIAQNFHSDGDPHTVSWGKQKSSYRGTVRKTVRTMIEAMRAAGFEVVSRREFNSLALQLEAMQRENDAVLSTLVVASEALLPFAAAVFNDNGEMSVDLSPASADDYIRAYFAERRARTLIQGEKK